MKPYQEGSKAYWDYEKITDNPYNSSKDCEEYCQWESGYTEARAIENGDFDE